jgi:hypothetical protein
MKKLITLIFSFIAISSMVYAIGPAPKPVPRTTQCNAWIGDMLLDIKFISTINEGPDRTNDSLTIRLAIDDNAAQTLTLRGLESRTTDALVQHLFDVFPLLGQLAQDWQRDVTRLAKFAISHHCQDQQAQGIQVQAEQVQGQVNQG